MALVGATGLVATGGTPAAAAPVFTAGPVAANGTVALSGTGFTPLFDRTVRIAQCAPIEGGEVCEQIGVATASQAGAFSASLIVQVDIWTGDEDGPSVVDCTVVDCAIEAQTTSGTVRAAAPLDLTALSGTPVSAETTPTPVGLAETASLDVVAAGFSTTAPLHASQCLVDTFMTCDPWAAPQTLAPASGGGHAGEVVVARELPVGDVSSETQPEPEDCSSRACALVLSGQAPGSQARRRVVIPLGFASPTQDVPSISVTPVGPNEPGLFRVKGLEFPAIGGVGFQLCPSLGDFASVPHFDDERDYYCERPTVVAPLDDDGSFSAILRIPQLLTNFGASFEAPDCKRDGCVVVVPNGTEDEPIAISPIVDVGKQAAVTLQNVGTISTTGKVEVQAVVRCAGPLTIDVSVSITQLAKATGSRNGLACQPGTPLTVFLTVAGGGALTAGTAIATVQVSGRGSWDRAIDPVGTSATPALIDHGAMVTAIQTAMADPANEALRQAVEAAILARIAQDPEFAEEFRRLLAGG